MKNTSGKTILETERLLLREMTTADFEPLCEILQDPEVMYAYEHAFSDEEVRNWLNNQLRRYREDGFGLWAVIRKTDETFIGQTGLTMQDIGDRQVVEVGYLFRKDAWGQGYATEAAQACKKYAFQELNLPEVWSIIRDSNAASQAVAKRNGMAPVGSIVTHYCGLDMPHILFKVARK